MKIKKNYQTLSGQFHNMTQEEIERNWDIVYQSLDDAKAIRGKAGIKAHRLCHDIWFAMMWILSDCDKALSEAVDIPEPAAILHRDNRKAGERVRYK
jgi:hypothetical protein